MYKSSDTGLSDDAVSAIELDSEGNVWIGVHGGGVAKFDGNGWTVYDTDNSGVPSNNFITALAADAHGNVWIGTNGGLAVYNEGGVIFTVVEETPVAELPSGYSLSQNYPNPFNATTQICFSVSEPSHVKIAIYSILGQLVRELVDGNYAPGIHHVRWDGTDNANAPVSSGVYFYRMKTGSGKGAVTKRMVLLR